MYSPIRCGIQYKQMQVSKKQTNKQNNNHNNNNNASRQSNKSFASNSNNSGHSNNRNSSKLPSKSLQWARGNVDDNSVAMAYSNKQAFTAKAPRSERFCMSEAIGTINGSITFSNSNRYYINPGLASTFPWLATQAQKWQQYRFKKLRFRYETRSSTTTTGSIIMSPDYNSYETPPSDEVSATNTQDAVENAVWKPSIICVLDPSAMFPVGPRKLIRSQAVAGDLSTYDAGRFFLCTSGMAGAATVGKLWVDYEVELFVPQNSTILNTQPSLISQFTRSTAQTLVTAVATNIITDVKTYDPLGVGSQVGGLWSPPPGVYHITGFVVGRSTVATQLEIIVQIYKNGLPLTAEFVAPDVLSVSTTVSPIIQVTFDDIVVINSGNTINIQVVMTGSGTLTLISSGILVNFQLC